MNGEKVSREYMLLAHIDDGDDDDDEVSGRKNF